MRSLGLVAVLLVSACSAAPAGDRPTTTPDVSGLRQVMPTEDGPSEVPQGAFTGYGEGCSNLLAYRGSADGTQFAVVQIDRDELGLALGQTTTVDLGTVPAGVEVYVDVYAGALPGETPYCRADEMERPAMTRWRAEAGTLTIELAADPEARAESAPTYRATIRLEKVHLVGPDRGFAVVVPSIIMDAVRVGWKPG